MAQEFLFSQICVLVFYFNYLRYRVIRAHAREGEERVSHDIHVSGAAVHRKSIGTVLEL